MIKVLCSSAEIEKAGEFLNEHKLVKHYDKLKNWDLCLLHEVIAPLPRTIRVVDLGCAGLAALNFFYALGFKDIHGIDLTVTRQERWKQAAIMLKSCSLTPPFHFSRGDLTKTMFPDHFFEVATSISVIEHGVDLMKFFKEMNRIIKQKGLLFVTADYWPEKMKTKADERPCGLSYTIFSKDEIFQLIELAGKYDFSLYKNSDMSALPDPYEKHILGDIYEHTFICMVFRKTLT